MIRTRYSYCIFYLEPKYYGTINQDLKDNGYHHVRAIVPTVKLFDGIDSRGHNKDSKEVPVLFNYGFMKIPSVLAYDRNYMLKMKRTIPGIKGWLRDTITLHRRRGKKARVENAEDFDDFSKVAMVSRKEVRRFIDISRENHILSDIPINKGDYFIFRHYPYIGIGASILKLDFKHQKAYVRLYLEFKDFDTWVPLSLVSYSIYENYNPHKSLVDNLVNVESLPNEIIEKNRIRNKRTKVRKVVSYDE